MPILVLAVLVMLGAGGYYARSRRYYGGRRMSLSTVALLVLAALASFGALHMDYTTW